MCGIAGLIGSPGTNAEDIVRRFLSRISHRGEVCNGYEIGKGKGWILGANRLAITSAGDDPQPINSTNGSVFVVYNGEIYNWREVGRLDGNAPFKECHVIADALYGDGSEILNALDGMFSLVWVDEHTGVAGIARDRMGIKPLYYAKYGTAIAFASEIKALAAEPAVKEIFELAPGCSMLFKGFENESGFLSIGESNSYVRENTTKNFLSPESLKFELLKSIEQCTDCSLDLGIYLSGGVDSSGIMALAKAIGRELVPLTIGNKNSLDAAAAKSVSDQFNARCIIGDLPQERSLLEHVRDTIEICESFEPNVIRQSSIQFYLAKMAADAGIKVVLCGEGADELFCGYPEFTLDKENWSGLRRQFLSDLYRTQLQRVDRMAMHYTTEVRVPYLMNGIVELALSSDKYEDFVRKCEGDVVTKYVLREALKEFLPDSWRLRRKIVLSEGAGMKGNDPESGLFSGLAKEFISGKEVEEIAMAFPEWSIRNAEEAIYFREFERLGYTKFLASRKRVFANKIHSIV